MPAKEPRPASHFRLNIGGHEKVGVFREVSGLESETEIIEHKSVDEKGNPFTRKVPGHTKWCEPHAQARGRREPRALEVA